MDRQTNRQLEKTEIMTVSTKIYVNLSRLLCGSLSLGLWVPIRTQVLSFALAEAQKKLRKHLIVEIVDTKRDHLWISDYSNPK